MNDTPKDLRFFKVILSSIADGFLTVNSDRIITSFTPAAERITGVPVSKAVGERCQDVFHSDICERRPLKRTLKTGVEAIDQPVNIINHPDDKVASSVSMAVLKDEELS